MSRSILIAATLFLTFFASAETLNVRVESGPEERIKLIKQLNKNGRKRGLVFQLAADNNSYDYRIAFAAGSFRMGGKASAAVLTPDCQVVLIVQRAGKWSRAGASNAVAKQIVKDLAALRNISP